VGDFVRANKTVLATVERSGLQIELRVLRAELEKARQDLLRLERGMRLQADPTVIYGLGNDFDGDLRRADLTRDTPYNTYTRSGLPPTPIALPGQQSVSAAVDPAPGSELYSLLPDSGTGATISPRRWTSTGKRLPDTNPVPRWRGPRNSERGVHYP